MGLGRIEHLNRYRIEQAKQRLAGGNQGIEQIAGSVGYPNHNYFTGTFVKVVGVTPQVYRKNPKAVRQPG